MIRLPSPVPTHTVLPYAKVDVIRARLKYVSSSCKIVSSGSSRMEHGHLFEWPTTLLLDFYKTVTRDAKLDRLVVVVYYDEVHLFWSSNSKICNYVVMGTPHLKTVLRVTPHLKTVHRVTPHLKTVLRVTPHLKTAV